MMMMMTMMTNKVKMNFQAAQPAFVFCCQAPDAAFGTENGAAGDTF